MRSGTTSSHILGSRKQSFCRSFDADICNIIHCFLLPPPEIWLRKKSALAEAVGTPQNKNKATEQERERERERERNGRNNKYNNSFSPLACFIIVDHQDRTRGHSLIIPLVLNMCVTCHCFNYSYHLFCFVPRLVPVVPTCPS